MNKLIKRVFSLLLCLCLLGSSAAFAQGTEEGEAPAEKRGNLTITNLDQFLRFAENCRLDEYSRLLDVRLGTDLDLSGTGFKGIPIFCGRFDGQGHSIVGLELRGDGSAQGLFRRVAANAVVMNIVLEGKVSPGGSRATTGTVVGSNAGYIYNCSFNGTVDGSEKVGGIAGENLVTGTIEACAVRGDISGNHFVGGIVGDNAGVVRSCENHALINTRVQENTVDLTELSLESLTSSEAAATVTDVGGIAGSSRGVIRSCRNMGAVGYKLMGYNIGGIAGSQMGYIVGCENTAAIDGRKEVGGIVGQMEPSAFVAFEQDALQILDQQLNGLAGIAGNAASNAQLGAGLIGGQMNTLMGQINETGQALGALMNPETGFNPDSIQAAQAVISSGVSNMTTTMRGMAATTQSVMGVLTNDLYAMQGQINAMRSTLGNITDTIGGSLKDLSDEDTPEQFTGKVENCSNSGSVHGELSVGGITGAIAVENDLDVKEDYVLGENNSLNFVSELRAVILNCHNNGPVSVLRMSGGGIAGWMQFGLMKECINSGEVRCEGAQYVGGMAGRSDGYIRQCSSNCLILGGSYVGGIAGEGSTVSDCRSMVKLRGSEKTGAILGYGEQKLDDEGQNMLSGNFYLPVDEDLGGIDGISYEGAARSLTKWDFFALEGLSDIFTKVYLRFVFEDGSAVTRTIRSGGRLKERRIPAIPEKPGYTAHWGNFENERYDFDESFNVVYTPYSSTLESSQRNDKGLAMLLAEGSFLPGSTLELTELSETPPLENGEKLIAAGGYESSDGSEAHTLRYYLEDPDSRLRALIKMPDGQWQDCGHSVLGSYAVMELVPGAEGFAIVKEALPLWYFAAGGGLILLLMAAAVGLLISRGRRRRRKRKNRSRGSHEASRV